MRGRGLSIAGAPVAVALALCCAVAGAQVRNVSNTPDRAEGEETVQVNPTDYSNVIVGSNQWTPLTPLTAPLGLGPSGVTTCAVWSSHDGGAHWKGGRLESAGLGANQPGAPAPNPLALPPEFGGGQDLGNLISADQNTVFDRHGNAYYACLNFGLGSGGDTKVNVYRSSDGGTTWTGPVEAYSQNKELILIDRDFIAIDNSGGPRDGTLYLTWETMFYQGWLPAVYERSSTDGGHTWGPVVRVDNDSNRAQWDPRQMPAVGADGPLYVAYDAADLISPAPIDPELTPVKLMVGASRDGGQTFTRSIVEPHVKRIKSPDEAFSYFTETISSIAADPTHAGRVAVAWPDARSGDARILLRYSTDDALHWSEPIDVADDAPGHGNQHDHVALSYLPDGGLVAVWRDRRCCGGAFGDKLEVFARVFDVDAAGRLTPGRTLKLTDSPQVDGQNTHGQMPTEYLGAQAGPWGLDASWDQLGGSYLDNVYTRVPIAALGQAASGAGGSVRRDLSHALRVHAARSCKRRLVSAWVAGRGIDSVAFRIDGRRAGTVRGAGGDGRFRWRLRRRLSASRHRIGVSVRFADGTRRSVSRVLRGC